MTANAEQLTILVTDVRGERIHAAFLNGRLAALERATRPLDAAIFVGRVENSVPGMHAAFVRYEDAHIGYLKYAEVPKGALFNRPYNTGQALKPGDLLAVQVLRYAQGTKQAKLTGFVSFSGAYTVLTYGKHGTGASAKMEDTVKQSLLRSVKRALAEGETVSKEDLSAFGVILRTEAAQLLTDAAAKKAQAIAPLLTELKALREQMSQILARARHLAAGTNLYRAAPAEIANEQLTRLYHFLRREDPVLPVEIKCEDPAVYEALSALPLVTAHADIVLKLHDNSTATLSGLYRLEHALEELDKRIVWLKSGAFLVIDHTEAMTVIDVNSGKNIKSGDNFFLKINLEAAQELMRQLRLRDITGIILVDFINMRGSDARRTLAEKLKELAARDTVRTQFVDFTTLGLAELTRAGV
ncbi:MAG: ribonuclease E/G [Lachnospiraceae bacterium]|nr:ribonuclease E/G [Lachnospiraceae bacterium]